MGFDEGGILKKVTGVVTPDYLLINSTTYET
jgi:hypothetical protein